MEQTSLAPKAGVPPPPPSSSSSSLSLSSKHQSSSRGNSGNSFRQQQQQQQRQQNDSSSAVNNNNNNSRGSTFDRGDTTNDNGGRNAGRDGGGTGRGGRSSGGGRGGGGGGRRNGRGGGRGRDGGGGGGGSGRGSKHNGGRGGDDGNNNNSGSNNNDVAADTAAAAGKPSHHGGRGKDTSGRRPPRRGRGRGRGESREDAIPNNHDGINDDATKESGGGRGGRGGRGRGRSSNSRGRGGGRGGGGGRGRHSDSNFESDGNHANIAVLDHHHHGGGGGGGDGLLQPTSTTSTSTTTTTTTSLSGGMHMSNTATNGMAILHNAAAASAPLLNLNTNLNNNNSNSSSSMPYRALSPFISAHHSNVMSGGGGVVPTHPPIFMSRLNTTLSDNMDEDDREDEEDRDGSLLYRPDIHMDGMGIGEEAHIAERLAAGLLVDDDDDGEEEEDDDVMDGNGRDGNGSGNGRDLATVVEDVGLDHGRHRHGDEKKFDGGGENSATTTASTTTRAPKGKLQFVKLPAGFSVGAGGNVVTADEARRQKHTERDSNQHPASQEEVDAGLATMEEEEEENEKQPSPKMMDKKKKKGPKRKNKKDREDGMYDEDGDIVAETAKEEGEETKPKPSISTSDAIKKLKAQEVSIGETTKVQIKRNESAVSLSSIKKDNDESSAPVINLLGGGGGGASAKKVTGSEKVKTKPGKKSKSKGKNKALGNDEAANLRAARHFNRSVRACVERSDPDGMREILRDKRNHHFALDSHVLETVMKAYVMAAMFEDALYCLRNCTLPGTLSTVQTERILLCLPQNLRNSSAFTAADMINALCIATEFDQPTSRTYFMRIVRGIALEFLEEATSARDRICSAPCERLVRSAQCVVDARLRRGKKATDLVVDPGHQLGVFIPDTLENRGMQAGDAVSILPYAGPYPMSAESLDRNMIEATVTNASPLVLRLQDKGNSDLHQMLTEPVEGNVYRVDKLANRMGFNRQLAAAVSVASPLKKGDEDIYLRDTRRPSAELIRAITAMDENTRIMMMGGNINPHSQGNANNLSSTSDICSQAIPWSLSDDYSHGRSTGDSTVDAGDQEALREESLLALEKYSALEGLNASQRLAVQGATTNRLTLVQGPPGTGKTAVAIRILQHWARLAVAQSKPGENPSPILATSDSNIAVDNLVEGCANVGLRVVRLGRPEAIRPELLRYCIDRPPEKGGSGGGINYGGISASAFKEKMKVLKNAQVVCCTCIGSGGDILDNMTFERVMVDEATQATEPAVLVPLTRGCRQLVLVGDHCQLPPTVLSTRAEEEGLGVPLFSRMVACGVPPFMLDTQYRMHPSISMFPSDLFYGGKLNDGVSPPERRPLQGFPWPREEFPVAFIPVTEGVELDDGVSKLNEAEAAAACDAVVALLGGGQCTVSDIAVVTPYAAQVRLIRRGLREMLPKGPPFVEVSSTDGFQGREKEAVIFSAVRSNNYGAVGFVSDWRRINVSFTRARRALIVIGNPETLRRGDPDTFGAWLQWADAHGVNMSNPGRPRGRYDPEVLRKIRGGTTAAEMLKDVLARQQAQLKNAERQQAQAEKNAAGHIMGKEDDEKDDAADCPQALKEDLALLENTDGCWDDSDDEDDKMIRNVSRASLATTSSSISQKNDGESSDGPLDAWDL